MSEPVREAETLEVALAQLRRATELALGYRPVQINRAEAHALLADRDRLAGEVDRYRDEMLDVLCEIGWMPCADSPFWCFCSEPDGPSSWHSDGCIRASGLLAVAGRIGSDGDPPAPETMTDSLGRSIAEEVAVMAAPESERSIAARLGLDPDALPPGEAKRALADAEANTAALRRAALSDSSEGG